MTVIVAAAPAYTLFLAVTCQALCAPDSCAPRADANTSPIPETSVRLNRLILECGKLTLCTP